MATGRKPMVSITAEQLPEVQKLLRQLPSWYADKAGGVLENTLQAYKREMVARSTSGPLFRQTGKLARSWGPKDGEMAKGESLKTLSAYIASFSDQKSFLHEFGGVVYPKGGSRSWLFIPTDSNKKMNGTPIKPFTQVRNEGGIFYNRRTMARQGEQMIFADVGGKTSTAWNLLLNADRKPMFIMVKHAQYVPTLGFFDAGRKYEQRLIPRLADLVVDYWKTAA